MKAFKQIILICVITGIMSGLMTNVIFWYVYPSAWLFFIIPAAMGFALDHFVHIPKSELADEDNLNKLTKKTGFICALLVFLCVLLSVVPLLILLPTAYILANIGFYAVCALSVYWGYNRGVRCITDAFYDSLEED